MKFFFLIYTTVSRRPRFLSFRSAHRMRDPSFSMEDLLINDLGYFRESERLRGFHINPFKNVVNLEFFLHLC